MEHNSMTGSVTGGTDLRNKQLYINMYDQIHWIFLIICKQT